MHTISVSFENRKERDEMWDFISTLPWTAILASEKSGPVAIKKGEEVLSSKLDGRKKIIFSSNLLPQWAWAIATWMAVKSNFKIYDDWSVLSENDDEVFIFPFHLELNNTLEVDEDGIIVSWRHNPNRQLNSNEQKKLMKEIQARWDGFTS